MGRYRKPDAKRHSVGTRLADEEYIAVTTVANELDLTLSETIRELIRFALLVNPEKAIKHLKNKKGS